MFNVCIVTDIVMGTILLQAQVISIIILVYYIATYVVKLNIFRVFHNCEISHIMFYAFLDFENYAQFYEPLSVQLDFQHFHIYLLLNQQYSVFNICCNVTLKKTFFEAR